MLEFQYEKAPASLRSAMGSLSSEGNPWGNERSKRGRPGQMRSGNSNFFLAKCMTCSISLAAFPPMTRNLGVWPGQQLNCCDRRAPPSASLGDKENCCGESVRKAGHESLFRIPDEKQLRCIRREWNERDRRHLPSLSKHFKEDYPPLKGETRSAAFHAIPGGYYVEKGKLSFARSICKKELSTMILAIWDATTVSMTNHEGAGKHPRRDTHG
jgi:hypothetical protein